MNYYNDIDPKAAAWIAELMSDGLIPAGEIDTRSICEVQPDDLRGYTQCHFFAGIGGWSLALRLAGWPDDKPVWTGSCPCQPFSCAGQGKGTSDERHLWPEFTRLIEACKPPILLSEQVASKAGREWLAGVFADLARLGYRRAGADLCAPGVQAPHLRQRIYFGAVALGHGFGTRLEGHARNGDQRHEPGRNGAGTAGPVAEASGDGRLACGDSDGRRADEPGMGQDRRATASGCGEAIGLADSESGGLGADGSAQGTTGHTEQRKQDGGVEHAELPDRGTEQQEHSDAHGRNGSGWNGHASSLRVNWRDSVWIHCCDGKLRRVPSQPLFLGVADGLPVSLDAMRAESGFPLCRKEEIKGRTMLLKGYGNAIVQELAAEFIAAFMEAIQ